MTISTPPTVADDEAAEGCTEGGRGPMSPAWIAALAVLLGAVTELVRATAT